MGVSHVLTDFDGAIADTTELNASLVAKLFPNIPRRDYLINHHLGNVYEEPAVPFCDETRRQFREEYSRLLNPAHLAAALPTIHALGRKHRLHAVSSNTGSAIRRVLIESGVNYYFGYVLGSEAHRSKVEKFQYLFEREQFTPEQSLYLTDTVGDILEAKKVGLRTVAVSFGFHPRHVLLTAEPTMLVDSWAEAESGIEQLMAV